MKKQLLGLMTILTVLGACQKNEVSVELSEAVTIHAAIEDNDATKTVMDESNNILWSENDQIAAFMKSSYGHKYQIKPSFTGKTYADFSRVSSASGDDLSAGMEWDHYVAYYPYSESIECVKSGDNYALEVVLPAEQTYEENSFGNGTLPMVAVSDDNNITFKNVCGGIKLQLKGTQTVKSITIQGKNNEKLSGAATVTAYTNEAKPSIVMAQDASTTVTLNCGEGVCLNESTATEFIIVLPPTTFTQGFSATIADINGDTQVIETSRLNEVYRSSILIMPEVVNTPDENDNTKQYGITNVTATTAIYHGYLDASADDLFASQVSIYYSDTDEFSIATAQSITTSTFDSEQKYTLALSGLKPNTEYSYCIIEKVKSEERYYDVKKFKTLNISTDAIEVESISVTAESATIVGHINICDDWKSPVCVTPEAQCR